MTEGLVSWLFNQG